MPLHVANLIHAIQPTEHGVTLKLPLPQTPLKTQQWVAQFCAHFALNEGEPDWGADRYQVVLSNETVSCLLCIEWLCEAIWLEPLGANQSPQQLHHYLMGRLQTENPE